MSKLSKRHRAPSSQGAIRSFDGMSKIHACAAGVDMGAHAIMACGLDGDDPAKAIIEAQDREIAEKSGLPPSRIKSLRRSGAKPSKEEKHEMKKAARGRR